MSGGKLNDPTVGSIMRGEGIPAEQTPHMFHVARPKVGLREDGLEISTAAFRVLQGPQLRLDL